MAEWERRVTREPHQKPRANGNESDMGYIGAKYKNFWRTLVTFFNFSKKKISTKPSFET